MIILLCGGAGTRFDSDVPKPLNLVNGKPMIKYVIDNLNVKKLTIIYNYILDTYNFKEYIINNFKQIEFNFYKIDFQTRGPVETIYLFTKNLKCNEQLIFLDNDNIYKDFDITNVPKNNFIIYTKNPTGLKHYSFVSINSDKIIDIQERNSISEFICIGGYAFESSDICNIYCKKILDTSIDEPYISYVFSDMIKNKIDIHAYFLKNAYSIGTPNDIILNNNKLSSDKLRIVFDLDNTIVTYPKEYKNYKTVERNEIVCNLIKKFKSMGHVIIINTARNMITSNNNIGLVLKNIGLDTLETLKKLNIEYDEINFGKPYGDLYIDDKAFNCNDPGFIKKMGFYNIDLDNDYFKTNKYNKIIKLSNNSILKKGPSLDGEIYYYSTINNSSISTLFPKFISNYSNTSIILEYINGTPLSHLYIENLLNENLFINLLDTVVKLHKTNINDKVILNENDIKEHYIFKFESRSLIIEKWNIFDNFKDVHNKILLNLHEFLDKKYPINNIIHGDLWFSNIMIYKNQYKFYDMRGLFNNKLTIKGHVFYDFAKIYQSLIGLDCIIEHGSFIDSNIKDKLSKIFWLYLLDNKIIIKEDITIIIKLTGYLLFCTFPFYDESFDIYKKYMIWDLINSCIY